MYADFPAQQSDCFVDFEVQLGAPQYLRRWFRPQVVLSCDGRVPFKPLPREQALPMLEWGLNWVISSHAHDKLVIHGAAVERDGRALILAADPGSGKSTLCAALIQKGWRLLSDELTLVSLEDGLVTPIARPVSLKNQSIEVVRALGAGVVLSKVCLDTAKGSVAHLRPPRQSVDALDVRALPALLVYPRYRAGAVLQSQPEGQAHSLIELTRHTFNYAVLAGDGFDALARLVRSLKVWRVEYGHLDQVLPELDRLWHAMLE